MKASGKTPYVLTILLLFSALYLGGCADSTVDPLNQTDDEYIQTTALNGAFSTDMEDDDNLLGNEVTDLDSDGPVPDNEWGGDTPIDTLIKWGRRVTNVSVNTTFTFNSDTIKDVEVKRTISGNYYIVGYVAGAVDTIVKPYVQEQRRLLSFKRINRTNNPRRNWRLYTHSAVDGQTTSPQMGKSNIVMNKIEIFVNNNLALTLNGPDFTINVFTSKFFGGQAPFNVNRGDQVNVKVTLSSTQTDPDIVAYHWARNTFGFHRERFAMTSQTANGSGFDRTYEKSFTVYNQHHKGVFNGYLSASTNSSLYDDNTSLFSSTYAGLPYRVR